MTHIIGLQSVKRTTEGYGGVCKSFGQAFDYLNKYHGSYMFVPRNVDGRNIAESWSEQIENLDKPIGLIVYDGDVDDCEVVVELKQQDINPERLIAKPDLSDRYWARYNDITPSEIISYLRACYVILEKDNRKTDSEICSRKHTHARGTKIDTPPVSGQ